MTNIIIFPFKVFSGHFWTVVPELSDKQTLRRRNRQQPRALVKKSDVGRTISRDERGSSGSGETSPSPSNPSISPPSENPKPQMPVLNVLELLSGMNDYKGTLFQNNYRSSKTQTIEYLILCFQIFRSDPR